MTTSYAPARVVGAATHGQTTATDSRTTVAVCVFCGARPGNRPMVIEATREVGRLIGMRGHRLVYGAGGTGLMGEVARSASQHGSAVTGYTTVRIRERELGQDVQPQATYVTRDLPERKHRMVEGSDAFIALPGGFGTLDEIVEVISLRYLDLANKPLVLLNAEGFWDGLIGLCDWLYEAGFAAPDARAVFHVATTPAEAVDLVERLTAARQPGWPGATS